MLYNKKIPYFIEVTIVRRVLEVYWKVKFDGTW